MARWITGPEARREGHRLRARADAVLIGAGTLRVDDPRLTVRGVRGRNPIRVVWSRRLALPLGATVFHDGAAPTWVLGGDRMGARALTRARLRRIGARGGDPFLEHTLPEAILKFRQGFGRLVRSATDHGEVVILDPRARTKRYGREFLAALPEGAGESAD